MTLSMLRKILNFAILLAFCVVMLGAYTRLTDAGLGCPDWPGCYGHLVLPHQSQALNHAQALYPELPIESVKAWTEMAHRYLAGSLLALVVLILALLGFHPNFKKRVHLIPIFTVIGLMIFQALLGMWTVTLKLLPIVVMGHLLGGFLILASLAAIRFQLMRARLLNDLGARVLIGLGFILTFLQVALGGWVSSNYAGISCLGFPTCNGLWAPALHLKDAFDVFHTIGLNYQGGLLDVDARMTIAWVHRLGAMVVWVYWFLTSIYLGLKIKNSAFRMGLYLLQFLLLLQISLGVINVVWMLPLFAAVLHNGVGASILVTILYLFHLTAGGRIEKCD